jgi:hypothetical protein
MDIENLLKLLKENNVKFEYRNTKYETNTKYEIINICGK